MSTHDEAWQALVDGGPPPTNPHVLKMILVRVRNQADHPDETRRLESLRVVRSLGTDEAFRTARAYTQDPSLAVRRRLLSLARDAGEDGAPVLRDLAADPDPGVAVDAVRQLERIGDRAATSRIRGLVSARHGVVRHQALVFLGRFAGPSVIPSLRPLLDDEDQGVRGAARWAIDTLEGRTDAPPPELGGVWAGEVAGALEDEAARARRTPRSLPDTGPPPPDAPPTGPSQAAGADVEPGDAGAEPAPAREAATQAAGGSAPPEETRPPAEDGTGLPADATVLEVFRAIAVHPDRRDALVARLREAPERDLSHAFRTRKPGEHPDLCEGAALAAASLDNPRWTSALRRLVGDPEPRVRAAVAQALGAHCTPTLYRNLEGMAVDTEPTVQAAGVRALARGAVQVGYEDQARRLIHALPETKNQALREARSEALGLLGGDDDPEAS
jgi:HEAT repeat protein